MRLHHGWYNMVSLAMSLANKASQQGLQEDEVEHGTFRAALPRAPVEADARHGAMCGDGAHRGAATEGVEELDELLWDRHVA